MICLYLEVSRFGADVDAGDGQTRRDGGQEPGQGDAHRRRQAAIESDRRSRHDDAVEQLGVADGGAQGDDAAHRMADGEGRHPRVTRLHQPHVVRHLQAKQPVELLIAQLGNMELASKPKERLGNRGPPLDAPE